MRKAIVIGSTGMVGSELIQLLCKNDDFNEIKSLVRRPSGFTHSKLTEHIIDFDQPDKWQDLVTGDVLFSTLGTTLKEAKSKENQFRIDYTYQWEVARFASLNGVAHYVLVSSAGANAKSGIFYSKMKGELEDAVKLLAFKSITILQPGQLDGNRTKKRTSEKLALSVMYAINKLGILKKYKPIHATDVARAMINASGKATSATFTLDEVHKLSKTE